MVSYFSPDFIKFFKELEKHNNREWFEKNKERYNASVKEPFKSFVEEMIVRLHFEDERINIEAKDAIFRIYRDIRFSKDKTPYKTHASALISPHGRKDLELPGFYFELSHNGVGIYGGAYMIDKNHLKNLRRFIASNIKEFELLLNNKAFRKYFGELKGEKGKRLDKEFEEPLKKQPLIANKQFYYGVELPSSEILNPKLPEIFVKHYKSARELNIFLAEGLNG